MHTYAPTHPHAHAHPTAPQERVEYSAEVLVTRSDLDEKRNRMAELEQQVRAGLWSGLG